MNTKLPRDPLLLESINQLVLAALNPLLDEATLDAPSNKSLFALFQKLDLLTTVTYVQWSKFPYHRNTLRFDQETLRDRPSRDMVASVVAENIVMLLVREMTKDSEAQLFLKLNSASLKHCLGSLYLNEFTGDRVAREIVSQAVESLMAQTKVDDIIATIGAKRSHS